VVLSKRKNPTTQEQTRSRNSLFQLSKSEIGSKPIPIHFPNLEQKVFLFSNFFKNNLENFFPKNREFVTKSFSADWPQFTTQKITEILKPALLKVKL
jgi:hypothetical protein